MIETKVIRMDYRKLNPVCAYCTDPATCIKVATTNTGDVLVGTLCDKHCKGEKEHCIKEGMTLAGETMAAGFYTDATLFDLVTMKKSWASVETEIGKLSDIPDEDLRGPGGFDKLIPIE